MKITTDLTGTENAATRHTRLKAIYDFYFGTGQYVAAGNLGVARAAMNVILPTDIANGETFASWLVKVNYLNEKNNAPLSLDFTTGSMPAGLTFTRASTATYFNSAGVIQTAAVDTPRFDYDPFTLACNGLLIEEARTNLLLNSATLSTQSVTTTAQAYTLTFYGTGSVALSGTYTGSLAGTGAANRVSLTFTATAGSLTATVTGSVTNAQIEAGAFATSYIPTTGSAATRAADYCADTTISDWFNAAEGTFVVDFTSFSTNVTSRYLLTIARAASVTDRIDMNINSSGVINPRTVVGGVGKAVISPGNYTPNVTQKVAYGYKVGSYAASLNGAAVVTSANTDALPTDLARMIIGSLEGISGPLNGHIRRVQYWPNRMSNSYLQGITA